MSRGSLLRRLYRGETAFDVVGNHRRWFIVSAAALLLCLGSLAVRNLNLGIDFTGGISITSPNPAGADIGAVRTALGAAGDTARIQLVDDGAVVRVQTESLDLEAERRMVLDLVAATGTEIELTDADSVGPTFGRQVTRRAVQALLVFLAVVVVFISIRFEWKMAVGAITALLHDLVITAGAYSLLGFEVTPATVVAVLTILGYSLYDTVVVYDKVRENVAEDQHRRTYTELVNRAMKPGADAFHKHFPDQPVAGGIVAVHRVAAAGGGHLARVRLGPVRGNRRRDLLLHLRGRSAVGFVEGAGGRVAPPPFPHRTQSLPPPYGPARSGDGGRGPVEQPGPPLTPILGRVGAGSVK